MTTSHAEPWALDKMERQGVARFLTQYLDTYDSIKVLNVNAPWGTGKTFFLNNWSQFEIINGRACVYFNAWETDFSGDAFVSLVASIRDQLEPIIGAKAGAKKVLESFSKTASKTFFAATPPILKGIVKNLTKIDIDAIGLSLDSEDLANAAEKSLEKLIESNKLTLRTVESFKTAFSKLLITSSEKAAGNAEPKPVYIFIDELDRCRPTFAVELLERIKHLFDVPSCKFIIATDTLQLSEAVRAIYGLGFDSEKYLRRFFDREYMLSTTNYGHWIEAKLFDYASVSTSPLGMVKEKPESFPSRLETKIIKPLDSAEFISSKKMTEPHLIMLALANTFKPSLRDLEKISHHIDAIYANTKDCRFHFFWAAYLSFLKIQDPQIYNATLDMSASASIDKISAKFSPRSFYFRHTNYTVHEIFLTYLTFYKGTKEEAYQKWQASGEQKARYMFDVSLDFSENHGTLSLYPKLVELAHSVK
ncbi:P-loop NTPase fold protein [Pseudomonas coleopterorum]|jgi:hypothetical protein|uniref:KAP family P-loop NTPase fold protein n=1 Tax=Pseudomonas coleopterorum TaxID=1605838 RepID=UPI002A6AFD13|nr:P-loop NTPase fold protein [Pseudomonas coleopterorum]MDY1015605.1 P-loop NTPase fold protein [Pseudomonas coleopterorum]